MPTVISPVTSNDLLTFQLSPACTYVIFAFAPATINPAPSTELALVAPLATVIFKSDIDIDVALTIVVLP